ncbi:prion protein b [Garra rufa]|uniref:prion protein b n=1 Tax=Garra rufa TaxID=137080 RepID=UPI003CCE5CB7
MGQLCKLTLFALVLMAVLHNSLGGKAFGGKRTTPKKSPDKPSQGTKTQPNYPRQPSYPSAGSNPGYPNQHYPGKGGSSPGAGSYPAGGSYPSAGGYPNQGRGGVNPGGYPNQNPAGGGYPNQYPGRSGYSPGGYPVGGSYPVRTAGQPGGYPGGHPGGYPGGHPGGYPGGHPGGQPSIGGGYPNWNPNNKILSPRYGGSYGGGGFGVGGSPFSNTVKSMGYGPSPKSQGFAKKAMLAAGVGAMAGMAVGYGIGNFQRPNFQFRNPQEERQYNHYMYERQDTRSKAKNNIGGPNTSKDLTHQRNDPKEPSQAQSYEQYMNTCMKRKDLLKEQDVTDSADHKNIQIDEPLTDAAMNLDNLSGLEKNNTTTPTMVNDHPKAAAILEEDDDTVSIIQIGYPALIEQMKARKCVELYLVYSESFAEKQKEDKKDNKGRKDYSPSNNHNGHCVSGVLLLLTTFFMLLSST